jgi:hypothetical protein
MNRIPVVAIVLASFAAVLLIGSCGDSDKSTGSVGDINDPKYVMVQDIIDSIMIPLATGFVTSGIEKSDGLDSTDYGAGDLLGKSAATFGDSVNIMYYPLTGWWVSYLHTIDTTEAGIGTLTMRDSLQFRDVRGRVQMLPSDSTDFFTDIVRLNPLELVDDTTSVSIYTRSAMTYDNLQSEVLTVDGVFNLTLSGVGLKYIDTTGGLVDGRIAVDFVIDQVTVPKPEEGETACPSGGVLTFTVTENLTTQIGGGTPQDIVWSVRITMVDENTYRVKVKLGALEFDEYTILDPCERTFVLEKRLAACLKGLAHLSR